MAGVAQLVEHQVVVLRVAGSIPVACPTQVQLVYFMDIIFLAAIAVYIFIKLRAELGKIDEDQKRDAIKNFIKEQTGSKINKAKPAIIASLNNQILIQPEVNIDLKSLKILDELDIKTRENLILTLGRAQTSPADFIKGAVAAFEMIIEAFASGEIVKIKALLSEKIYSQFEIAINQRKSTNQNFYTKILTIDESKIISAEMVGNFAQITVRFISKQINYVTSENGEITEGSKEEVNEVTDVWTFKKDCQSENPNWFISATLAQ